MTNTTDLLEGTRLDALEKALRHKEPSGSKFVSGERVTNRRNFDGEEAAQAIALLRQRVAVLEGARAAQECQVPPDGWRCKRKAGHEGPCAAIPSDNPTAMQIVRRLERDAGALTHITPQEVATLRAALAQASETSK